MAEKKPIKKKTGRPTKYSKSLAEKICKYLARGMPLTKVVRLEGMPSYSRVLRWRCPTDPAYIQEFSDMYDRARQDRADALVDEMLEIADNTENDTIVDKDGNERPNTEWIQRARLRVDTRKFIASKMKPKVYGDSTKHTHEAGEKGFKVILEDYRGRDKDPTST